MKIAYIANNFGSPSETFVSDLANGLAKTNGQITIICNQHIRKTPNVDFIEETNYQILNSIVDRLGMYIDKLFGKQREFRQNLKRYQKHAYKRLLPALKKHQPDVAYIDYGKVAVLARDALQELNIPFVIHFHGYDITTALNNSAYREELQKVFHDASALIVPSYHVQRLLVLEGAPAKKIYLVRIAPNLEGLVPASWSDRTSKNPSIAFLGRFTPKKNPIALVEAFALVKQQVPVAQLTMIGDGPEMSRVRQRIEQLELNNSVMLHGTLPRSEALPIVNKHWVFAQHSATPPSGDQEGFPVVLTEAAALQLPIVSTLHSGIPEQVIDGTTGFLVQEFDYEAMAEYIIKLLQNPDLAEQMGKAGRENISQMCQTERRVYQIHEILVSVYNSRLTVS